MKIITLCGSVRFREHMEEEKRKLNLAGYWVLMPENMEFDAQLARDPSTKQKLDSLHRRKIDLSDEVLIVNVGGYIGESTRAEMEYALSLGLPVSFVERNSGASQ